MTIEYVSGDVLDCQSDALLLTIDGAKRVMEGNIARQFGKRFPEDWEDMQRALKYPIPIGRTVCVQWDGNIPWHNILFASTLHHLGVLEEHEKLRVIRMALTEALRLCARYGITSMATAVMQGGWRLSQTAALQEMTTTYQTAGCPQVKLLICQTDSASQNELVVFTEE